MKTMGKATNIVSIEGLDHQWRHKSLQLVFQLMHVLLALQIVWHISEHHQAAAHSNHGVGNAGYVVSGKGLVNV
jgi:hypothetical protein